MTGHRVRHLFLNLPMRAGRDRVEDTLAKYGPLTDVWGFAEAPYLVARGYTLDGFDLVTPYGGCPTPLFYRTSLFALRGVSWRHITPPTRVGREGAGPAVLQEKRLATTLLEHLPSGLWWSFSLFHAAPSIYLPVRDELHEEQVDAVALEVAALRADVRVLSGDFNAPPDHQNMRELTRRMILDSDPDKPTHDRRTIDLTYRLGTPPGLDVHRAVWRGPLADDHDAQRTVYRWPAAPTGRGVS